MKYAGLLVAAAATLSFTAPAQAALLDFTITGDYTASFQLDSSPVPSDSASGLGFVLWDVPGFPDAAISLADIYFYNAGVGGGMEISDFYGSSTLLVTDGPQLYSGSEFAPTFLLGTYALTQYQGSGTYTLTIADAAAGAVPEPATWAMMIGGFGLVGAAMRRRAGKVSVSFQAA